MMTIVQKVVKKFVVGYNFKLPRVPIDIFRELVKICNYDNGLWSLRNGDELAAYKVFSKHFTNFVIVKRCNFCNEEFEVNDKWELKQVTLDDYVSGSQEYYEHVNAHIWDKNKENRIFEDLLIELGNDISDISYWLSIRRCPYCLGHEKFIEYGYYYEYLKCKICDKIISRQIDEKEIDYRKWNIKMTGFRVLFKGDTNN